MKRGVPGLKKKCIVIRKKTESQPGDWKPENKEAHEGGRKEWEQRARSLKPYRTGKQNKQEQPCSESCEEKGGGKDSARITDRICLLKSGCFNCPIALRLCFLYPFGDTDSCNAT